MARLKKNPPAAIAPGPYVVVASQMVGEGMRFETPDFRPDLESLLAAAQAALRSASQYFPTKGQSFPFKADEYIHAMIVQQAKLDFENLSRHMSRWGGEHQTSHVQFPQLDFQTNVALCALRTATKNLKPWWDARTTTKGIPAVIPSEVLEQMEKGTRLLEGVLAAPIKPTAKAAEPQGRPVKYRAALNEAMALLDKGTEGDQRIYNHCKRKFPQSRLPKLESFMRRVRDHRAKRRSG